MANAPGPAQAARGMANAEYNPAIDSLKQALLDVVTQGQYDQHQLKGYYGQMTNLDNSQYADQQANQQAALQGLTSNIGNAAQLFGGSNAQQMQGALGNATGLLSTEGQSQQDYLQNMLPLLEAQGAQGSSELAHTVLAQQKNYNDQLTSQQQAKGAAYNADYQQALSNQQTIAQNKLALQQAQALFPSQLSASQSTAKADRVNANAAGAYNQSRINAENASASASAARAASISNEQQSVISKNMAEARAAYARAKASTAKGKALSPLAPGSSSYNRIAKGLYDALSTAPGKNNKPIANPIAAQHALYAEAVAQGLINRKGQPLVPGANKLFNSVLAEMYNRNANWQKGYKWNGRKFAKR